MCRRTWLAGPLERFLALRSLCALADKQLRCYQLHCSWTTIVPGLPLTDIASRQHLSLSYLEQLFSGLRLQGLVTSIRGPGGGYSLGRRIDGIPVADIICAVEDSSSKTKQPDAALAQYLTQDLWDSVNAKVLDFAQSLTLNSLLLDQLSNGVKIEQKPSPNRGGVQETASAIRPSECAQLGFCTG